MTTALRVQSCSAGSFFFDDGNGPNHHFDFHVVLEVAADGSPVRRLHVDVGRLPGAVSTQFPEAFVEGPAIDGRFVTVRFVAATMGRTGTRHELSLRLQIDLTDGRIVRSEPAADR